MEAIEDGAADFAVLPIENSTAGGLHQLLILQLPAHGHQLSVKLPDSFSVKFRGHPAGYVLKLLPLPLPIQNLSSCFICFSMGKDGRFYAGNVL